MQRDSAPPPAGWLPGPFRSTATALRITPFAYFLPLCSPPQDPDDYRRQLDDPFVTAMMTPHAPIVATRAMLRALRPSEVVVRPWPNARLRKQYFRIMDAELPLTMGPCGHFFELVRGLPCNGNLCICFWAL